MRIASFRYLLFVPGHYVLTRMFYISYIARLTFVYAARSRKNITIIHKSCSTGTSTCTGHLLVSVVWSLRSDHTD